MWFFKILSFLIIASACSFKPVYNDNFRQKFASIEVEGDFSENDLFLKEKIIEVLNPTKSDVEKLYILRFSIRNDLSEQISEKRDSSGNVRYSIKTIVKLELLTKNNLKIVKNFEVISFGSQESSKSQYADYVSEDYTIRTNLEQISNFILSELTHYFYSESKNENTTQRYN